MLVLSRKINERVRIGDFVTVTVVRIGPNSVRLGIEAPSALNIVRDELSDTHAGRVEFDVPLADVSVGPIVSDRLVGELVLIDEGLELLSCNDCRSERAECDCVGADA